ncbi:DUF943 family protein [Serratia rubidaea]|uniref:DUF943 family protein n=1 Tax=Serratia rubidaea TaxID=61652 RepID=UPI003AEF3A41
MSNVKSDKRMKFFCFFSAVLLGGILWLSLRPVKIIDTHQLGHGFSVVLVDNFPLTDKGKIDWWLKNNEKLKKEHTAPVPDSDGFFEVTFFDFGDGYKEEGKYDRLCFDDMKPPKNCIEKDAVFSVSHSRNLGTVFTTYEGRYKLQENGEIVAYKSTFEAR